MAEAGIDMNINKWGELLTLGVVDPHDSLSHPAGVSDAQSESATRLDPDQFTSFQVYSSMNTHCLFLVSLVSFVSFFLFLVVLPPQMPNWFGGEPSGSTKENPFPLPSAYLESQQRNVCALDHHIRSKYFNITHYLMVQFYYGNRF